MASALLRIANFSKSFCLLRLSRSSHGSTCPRARGRGPWIRIPAVAPGGRTAVLLGIAVFAPGITATSFVLSLGPSLLSNLLGATNRVLAGGLAFVMFLGATGIQCAVLGAVFVATRSGTVTGQR
ncbi:hypothetical protein ACQPZ2_32015 [Nocardia pseudovaccinii]|uniref:hypothetical protein n=1 Tax=Nocardia pseudovaccinii TaxID=189540 RepID=UPI003D94C398